MKFLLSKHITNILPQASRVFLAAIIAIALISSNSYAQEKDQKSSHQLQAELIYNFVDHTTWLENSPKSKTLCVMNDNPVIPYINFLVEKKSKNIVVIRKYENDYLDDCNILFVNEFYQGYLRRLLNRVKNKPILTFGNLKNFAKNGGIVQFTLRNDRVEFLFNKKEMKSSKLKINKNIISISPSID
jgi:hypothetical protein